MFDTIHVNRRFDAATFTATVTEKRAPTDDSVRLLKEMEKAARDKIIASIELDSNLVKGRVFVMKECLSGKNKFAVIMNINGKRIEIQASTDEFDSPEAQMQQLYQEIGMRIAAEVMPDVYDEARKGMLFR